MKDQSILLIGVVGPCAAGKSTLVSGLLQHGCRAKNIAQEHSFVKDMWQRITKPDVLIFLDVTHSMSIQRRKMDWSISEYLEQIHRLQHAREHADLIIETDQMLPEEVLKVVMDFLKSR